MPDTRVPAPLLSVTVLNYNYGRYLPECIESILSQTFEDFELIVIDDCSTDGSLAVIEPFLKDRRVRLVTHERNLGFRDSLIEGTERHSRGEFLTLLSADDFARDATAFQRQIDLLRSAGNGVFCFPACTTLFGDGSELINRPFPRDLTLEPAEALRMFLNGAWAMHSGTMFRASAYHAAGGYRRDITMPLDVALYFSICMQGQTVYCATPLYTYRTHEGQMSSTRMRLNNREVIRVIEDACRAGEARGLIGPGLTSWAIRRHLRGSILNDAIYGTRRQTVARIMSWLEVQPLNTLRSEAPWVALVRIVLGNTVFGQLRSLLRRLGFRTRLARLPDQA
ncbi:MAG TPA: glycosyltransferase family A protein [Dehalococcoidia bacterium]|nr:glycosyltransferase family A protein [Dehalococcoidia bacterium]